MNIRYKVEHFKFSNLFKPRLLKNNRKRLSTTSKGPFATNNIDNRKKRN